MIKKTDTRVLAGISFFMEDGRGKKCYGLIILEKFPAAGYHNPAFSILYLKQSPRSQRYKYASLEEGGVHDPIVR